MKKVINTPQETTTISIEQIRNTDYIKGIIFIVTNGKEVEILRYEPPNELTGDGGGFIFRCITGPWGHAGFRDSIQGAINARVSGWECYAFENMKEFIQALTPDFKLKGI